MKLKIKYETLSESTEYVNSWVATIECEGLHKPIEHLHNEIKCQERDRWPEGDEFLRIVWIDELLD